MICQESPDRWLFLTKKLIVFKGGLTDDGFLAASTATEKQLHREKGNSSFEISIQRRFKKPCVQQQIDREFCMSLFFRKISIMKIARVN